MAAAPETARQLQSAIFLPQRKIKKWAAFDRPCGSRNPSIPAL
jgi:hypothetical protein